VIQTQEVSTAGEMAPSDLLDTKLPQAIFNLKKKKHCQQSIIKRSTIKQGVRVYVTHYI